MNLFTKLVISLVTAGVAAAVITKVDLNTVYTWLVISAATVGTTLLSLVKMNRPAPANAGSAKQRPKKKSGSAPKAARKSSGKREEGEVKWFNVSKGFGFIIRENGEEIFVHFRSIRGQDKERRSLRDGQRVSYEVADSDKGPQAEDVEPL
jgi:CspA family cold shock protein